MVSIVGVCRASRGLIQAFASLFHCRPCRFHGHRTSGQATFVATFSRLLAIFCTFRTFCPTRCFVDKILRVYMCQTIYVYIYTPLRIQLPLNYSVFFKVHTKGQLCSVRATLILRGATAFITRVLQATNTEHDGERRDTRYRHCSMRKRSTWLRDVGFKNGGRKLRGL